MSKIKNKRIDENNSNKNKCDINHIYLNKSKSLRPDLSK